MKYLYPILFFAGTLTTSYAQFTPPDNAVSTVSVNSNTNALVAPTATTFFNVNFQTLTIGDGLQLASGTTFNGTVANTASVNKANLLAWLNGLGQDFYLFVDMSPTPYDKDSFDIQTSTQNNVFYYSFPHSLGYAATIATKSGVSVPLTNATNVMHSTTSSVPASYAQSSFSVSTLSATLSGNIIYDKATAILRKTALTVAPNGNPFSTYTTNDKVVAMRYWTDCEMKVIDKWGNIVYFTSTILLNNSQVATLHPEITDKNPTIWFFGSYGYTGCYGIKTQFTNFNSSIGATIGTTNTITGIWIYPDLSSTATRTVPVWTGYNVQSGTRTVVWGDYIREVMQNSENNIIIWRQTTSQGEYYNSQKLWRPVLPTFYGDYKEIN